MQQAEEIERDGRAALERIRVHPSHAKRLPPDVHAELLADAQLHTPRGIANTLRYTTPNVPVRERVKDLRVPTLLVCGERETRFVPNRASPSTRSGTSGGRGQRWACCQHRGRRDVQHRRSDSEATSLRYGGM